MYICVCVLLSGVTKIVCNYNTEYVIAESCFINLQCHHHFFPLFCELQSVLGNCLKEPLAAVLWDNIIIWI